jgi:hypothetical protein
MQVACNRAEYLRASSSIGRECFSYALSLVLQYLDIAACKSGRLDQHGQSMKLYWSILFWVNPASLDE